MVDYPDISLKIKDLLFEKPVIIGSGPITRKTALVKDAEENGAGAVSLKLSFVKPPFQGEMRAFSVKDLVIMNPIERRLSMTEAVELIKECRRQTSFPLFINVGGSDALDEWKLQAEEYQKAGVHALELNLCCPNLDTSYNNKTKHSKHEGMQLGQNEEIVYNIVNAVRSVSDLPLVPKLLPNALKVDRVIQAAEKAGANGIHLVSTPVSGLAPIDVHNEGRPTIPLLRNYSAFGSANGTLCKYSAFRMTAEFSKYCKTPLIVSGGIDTWEDAVTHLMLGAHTISVCSAPMWHGWSVIKKINQGLISFMKKNNYGSLSDFRGIALDKIVSPDKLDLVDGCVRIDNELCIKCGKCTKPAHCDALTIGPETIVVNERNCTGCGVCCSICPKGAISYKAS